MIVAGVLALYCHSRRPFLPRLLDRAAWADRAPRLAIAMWQAAGHPSWPHGLLAAFALAIPASVVGHGLAGFFDACAAMLSDDADLTSASTRVGLARRRVLAARVVHTSGAVLIRARGERRRHAEALTLLGRHDGRLGALVVDYEERMAYCLPGRNGQAVITTGALRTLAAEQVAAVLAHERAHLRGRHHLVLAGAEALARAFPRVPLFERARTEIARLIELLADDVAARRHPRIHLAAALVSLATGRVPAFALGAGGATALTRVRRMLNPVPHSPAVNASRACSPSACCWPGLPSVAAAPGISAFLAHHCHSLFTF